MVNTLLIVGNVLAFLYQFNLQRAISPRAYEAFIVANGMVPAHFSLFLAGRIGFEQAFLPLLTSMFLHGGLLHIAFNMLFLWIFGDNVEDTFGHAWYLLFYLVCGVGSGLLHVAFNWGSHIPAIGASGAISGVMGAYIILFPRQPILTLVFIFLVRIPAFFLLGYWFVLQFLEAFSPVVNKMGAGGGVAVWAHIGGFIWGMVITLMTRKR